TRAPARARQIDRVRAAARTAVQKRARFTPKWRGDPFLVGEDLGVGEPAVVVDRDVDVFVADAVPHLARLVGVFRVVVLAAAADAPAGAPLDAAELLDVEMDELAGAGALVAERGFEPEPAEPAHAAAGQDPRNGRERHPERLRDLR